MNIDIERDKSFKTKIKAKDIHGLYPYKLYLEIKGNSKLGKYIVVVSDTQLNSKDKIDEIVIHLENAAIKSNNYINQQVSRPNMVDANKVKYKVRERNIIDVDDNYLIVFKPV